jgi:hypothetical protein
MTIPRTLTKSEAQQRQTLAMDAYKALLVAMASSPSLATNPYFSALREAALARCRAELEAGQ